MSTKSNIFTTDNKQDITHSATEKKSPHCNKRKEKIKQLNTEDGTE